ncbi:hypothetical protein [Litorilituus sediminis]|uniref:Porin family protein n=1 Tax=Litorilituus sediminis TaxID=718192 RepID=A0A4P6P5R9_9GAMM|nr:hypothetical protein [Litorilituus sediminis]QBG36921.1 hypothetical protein EMK97_14920 [Litorilituus sediminis]
MNGLVRYSTVLLLLQSAAALAQNEQAQQTKQIKQSTEEVAQDAKQLSQCQAYCQSQKSTDNSYEVQVEQRQNSVSSIGYEPVNKKALPPRNRWSDFLPIWGKEAREEGYLLPLPFGISVVGLTQKQPFTVSKIGLALDGKEDDKINDFIDGSITAKNLEVSDTTFNLRFDAWILPFWNIYGLVGRTEGKAELELDFDFDLPTPLLIVSGVGSGLNANRCASINLPYKGPAPGACHVNATDVPTSLSFNGTVLGYGTTVAGGYGDFFGMFDVNYSEADINIAVEKTQQTVYSARLGWNGAVGIFQGQIWVGAMKQDIEQVINVKIPSTDLAVVIDQHTSSPVNYLLGAQWNITEEWAVIAETNFAFSDRQQFMMQIGYRF